MRRPLRLWSRSLHGGVFGLLVAAVAAVAVAGPFRPDQPAAAQPVPARAAVPLPTELQYVPADAAFFLRADAATIWTSDLARSFRAADKAPFVKLEDAAAAFGVKIDDLKSVVLFIPKLKVSDEGVHFGVVLTFAKPFDKKKLEAGTKEGLPKNAKVKALSPTPKMCAANCG